MFHQVSDQLIVAPRCSVVYGVVTIIIARIHIGAHFLDEIPDGRQPTVRDMPMGICCVALSISST
jgi:hypothetical protein